MIPALKYCPCCQIPKPPEGYSPDRRNKDGLNYRCKACHAASLRVKYKADPTPFQKAMKKYRESLRDYST